jgi:IS30 family transposase
MLRQYFPKGSDLRRLTARDLDDIVNLINDRPRLVLKRANSNDLYHAHLTTANQPAVPPAPQVAH